MKFAAGFITAIFTAIVPSATACSCLPASPPREALTEAAAVFSGKVQKVELVDDKSAGGGFRFNRVTLAVSQSWKGTNAAVLVITTAADSAACGFPFAAGKEYLVYAHESSRSPKLKELGTGLCSRTRELAQAAEDLKALGVGTKPPAK